MNYVEHALELAVENVKEGGHPFGAVLVQGDKVIAEGVNQLHHRFDVTAHAELEVIRKAQESLQTQDLSDCTMYASGEPCPMCLTAMYFAGIKTVYYSQSINEAEEAGLGMAKTVYMDLAKPNEQREINMIHTPFESKNEDPMELYKQQNESNSHS
ncbi:nucleoside deaminase [Pontibacillus yanchengensis]|uniref:Nucleoside deaminase n=1 Tax=Pontibacillus yanchengensis TaxID=462910 RepID=A0A6I5A0L6_9BACI|nr:nucleoside deaminase [Pontibacillus yanchengensis]MYL34886.1 nucleoside deaminase [Pontibacillus yanchengensis]